MATPEKQLLKSPVPLPTATAGSSGSEQQPSPVTKYDWVWLISFAEPLDAKDYKTAVSTPDSTSYHG